MTEFKTKPNPRRNRQPTRRPKLLCSDYVKRLRLAKKMQLPDLVDFYERMLRIHCERKERIPLK